jgi:hypothetical protein
MLYRIPMGTGTTRGWSVITLLEYHVFTFLGSFSAMASVTQASEKEVIKIQGGNVASREN